MAKGGVSEAVDGLFSTPHSWLDDKFLCPVQGLDAIVLKNWILVSQYVEMVWKWIWKEQ